MTTFIDTSRCPRVKADDGQGEFSEIVNQELCGAENVTGMLRWLTENESLDANPMENTHQLIYLMEGAGVITLEGKDYNVSRGAGIYLGPDETARISQSGAGPLKLLHLVVPRIS
jgi:mannose-6-phosphate isomerase-like protein (cupin superfamily)